MNFFIPTKHRFVRCFFLIQGIKMQNEQNGPTKITSLTYDIAHVVYAETCASSLDVIEALTSMIANRALKTNQKIQDIISDENVFESLNENSAHHKYLFVDENEPRFQICVRTAQRMKRGMLGDKCRGAISFHRESVMPDWARSRGYIAELDGLLFYR